MKPGIAIATFILLISTALSAAASQRKTDIVTLYNGDRITGEIRSLLGGRLSYNTDALGNISVEWQEIANVESKYNYEVRLGDGSRYFGSLLPAKRPGQLLIADLYGEHDIEWLEVVELRPIEKNFKDRIDVRLATGFQYTKASSVGQVNFDTDISYENEKSSNLLTARHTITDNKDDITRSTSIDIDRRIWTDVAKRFRSVYGSYESNDQLGLEHRFALGMGVGKYFVDTNSMNISGAIGLQGTLEEPESGDRQKDVEGVISSRFAFWKFSTPELDTSVNVSLYPSVTDGGRLRGDADIRVSWEIVEDLFWDITAWTNYDNKGDSDEDYDFGITTGIGWEY